LAIGYRYLVQSSDLLKLFRIERFPRYEFVEFEHNEEDNHQTDDGITTKTAVTPFNYTCMRNFFEVPKQNGYVSNIDSIRDNLSDLVKEILSCM